MDREQPTRSPQAVGKLQQQLDSIILKQQLDGLAEEKSRAVSKEEEAQVLRSRDATFTELAAESRAANYLRTRLAQIEGKHEISDARGTMQTMSLVRQQTAEFANSERLNARQAVLASRSHTAEEAAAILESANVMSPTRLHATSSMSARSGGSSDGGVKNYATHLQRYASGGADFISMLSRCPCMPHTLHARPRALCLTHCINFHCTLYLHSLPAVHLCLLQVPIGARSPACPRTGTGHVRTGRVRHARGRSRGDRCRRRQQPLLLQWRRKPRMR